MILFPAIDLRRGRCVRLRQGDPAAETVYGEDPAAMARHWAAAGATWLHVVNLDGALGESAAVPAATGEITPELLAQLPVNLQCLQAIAQAVALPVQFGGGLRSEMDVALALALGARRVVLGTAAVQDPALVEAAVARFGPERIVAGIDARQGRVATHGWQQTSTVKALDLALAMRELGVRRIVHTDISRDGTLGGANIEATAALARRSGLAVIASGGVRDLADIERLRAADPGIEGAIVGQALYTGALDLGEALAAARRARL